MNDWLDYLEHSRSHKYISKEFKNGKWQYYYYDKNGKRKDHKLKNVVSALSGANAKERMSRAEAEYNKANSDYESIRDSNLTLSDIANSVSVNNGHLAVQNVAWDKHKAELAAYEKKTEAKVSYEKARDYYNGTPMGIKDKITGKSSTVTRSGTYSISKKKALGRTSAVGNRKTRGYGR